MYDVSEKLHNVIRSLNFFCKKAVMVLFFRKSCIWGLISFDLCITVFLRFQGCHKRPDILIMKVYICYILNYRSIV